MGRKYKAVNRYPLIVEAYTKYGRTVREIALFFGISHKTVANILERMGVEKRMPGKRTKAEIAKYDNI